MIRSHMPVSFQSDWQNLTREKNQITRAWEEITSVRGREIIFSCTQRRRKEDGLWEGKKLRLKGSLKRGADGREERRRQIQNPWIHPREKKKRRRVSGVSHRRSESKWAAETSPSSPLIRRLTPSLVCLYPPGDVKKKRNGANLKRRRAQTDRLWKTTVTF